MFVVDKILDAAKKTVKRKDGASLTVMEVTKLDNGDIRIQVSVDEVQNPAGPVGGIRIQAVGRVQSSTATKSSSSWRRPTARRTPSSPLRAFLTPRGKPYTLVETLQNGFLINGDARLPRQRRWFIAPGLGQGLRRLN